jgi:hypothetical protein
MYTVNSSRLWVSKNQEDNEAQGHGDWTRRCSIEEITDQQPEL